MRKEIMENVLAGELNLYVYDMSKSFTLKPFSFLNTHPTYICRN